MLLQKINLNVKKKNSLKKFIKKISLKREKIFHKIELEKWNSLIISLEIDKVSSNFAIINKKKKKKHHLIELNFQNVSCHPKHNWLPLMGFIHEIIMFKILKFESFFFLKIFLRKTLEEWILRILNFKD